PSPLAGEGREGGNGGASSGKNTAVTPNPVPQGGGQRVFASPLARRLAEQSGIDLSGLRGSGPNGRIVKTDIEAALKSPQPRAQEAAQQESRALTQPTAPQHAPAPF